MLRMRLLGEMHVELDGLAIPSTPSQRPWALCAYLALAQRPVSRAELASRFWPDVLDASARASLRSALWALRRQLGDWLVVGRDHVGLQTDPAPWIDVCEYERLAAAGKLEQALALCRGELLEGLEDEWALASRSRHSEAVLALLEELADGCEQHGERRDALAWTRRQVEHDPFDEESHRRLISRLDAAGDRAAAVRVYHALAERLRAQLGVAPSARTRELIERVRSEQRPSTGTGGAGRAPSIPGAKRASSTPRAKRALSAPGAKRASSTPGALPFVGREAELALLLGAWSDAAGGSGVAAVLRGESGIGKTRLATELRRRVGASGGRAVACAALDLGGAAPFSLWAELIRELLPELEAPPVQAAWPDDLAALAAELPAHFGRAGRPIPSVAPELQRTRLFEAVVALLAWAAREQPLLLVLEDIHTADRPSLELAAYAARRTAELPLMLLFTRRQLPRSGAADALEHALRARGVLAAELELGPLPTGDLAALARTAATLTEAQIGQVVKLAEGNALLAVETARSLARGGEQVPANLRASVRASLADVSSEGRRLVELAAVAGRPLEQSELDQLELASFDATVGEALETGLLLAGSGRVGFRHALLREAVRAELTEPRTRTLHLRWAESLLASERAGGVRRPAEAARHFLLAGRNGPAVEQLARAAADARALGALEQAAAYLEEALAIDPARSELLLELGGVEAWRARREQAEAAFVRARDLLAGSQPLALARAWLQRGRAYHGPLCVPHEVLASSRAALELLEQAPEPAREERHEALAACVWSEAVAGNLDEAERLLAALEADTPNDDLDTYDVAHARAYVLMRRGQFKESWEPSVRAAEAAVRAGRPDLAYGCWAAAAGAAAASGDYERALELIDRGRVTLKGTGLTSIEVHMLAARSFLLRRIGLLDEARKASELEQRLAATLEQPELVAMANHDRGLVALEAGDYELAAELLAAALVQGAPVSRPLTRLALAEALARMGELERATEEVRATVLEPIRPSDFPDALVPRLARVQGLIAAAAGDRDLAGKRLRESVAGWEQQLTRAGGTDNMTAVLADLGRPVVGLVEPERELERACVDLAALGLPAKHRSAHAIVP